MWTAARGVCVCRKGTSKHGGTWMQGDPKDCSIEQLEPRQSPGPRAGLEYAANKLNSERLDEMTFTLTKSPHSARMSW